MFTKILCDARVAVCLVFLLGVLAAFSPFWGLVTELSIGQWEALFGVFSLVSLAVVLKVSGSQCG